MDYQTISTDELKLSIPSGIVVSGPSSSGKTALVLRLLKHADELFNPSPKAISKWLRCQLIRFIAVWGYGEYSNLIPQLEREGVIVCAGLPEEDLVRRVPKPCILVLDDLMGEVDPKRLADFFTKKSHHNNFTVIFLSQNLFDKALRVPRSNAQYIFLMRAPNDMLSIRNLAHQLFPKQSSFLLDSYKQASVEPYGYLLSESFHSLMLYHFASYTACKLWRSSTIENQHIPRWREHCVCA